MAYKVELFKAYFHPRTHKRITAQKAKLYQRRTGKRVRPQQWVVVKNVVGDTTGWAPEQIRMVKREVQRRPIVAAAKLTETKAILRVGSLKERHVRQTLGAHRVYQRLCDDFEPPGYDPSSGEVEWRRGAIRIRINGTVDGRRIKEVIHLAFSKTHWETGFSNVEHAKEGFKDWLVGAILSNLRRRGLRLSDPVESAGRIQSLLKKRANLVSDLDHIPPQFTSIRGGKMEQIRWTTDAIRAQKKSRQLRGATIQVEKLI